MSEQSLFCLKMRAEENTSAGKAHISGAEKIIAEERINDYAKSLIERALHHSKGAADFINLKIERVKKDELLTLDALSVTNIETKSVEEGYAEIRKFLADLKIEKIEEIVALLKETYAMRGAMLLDVRTLERLEPDKTRGIRATYMDMERSRSAVMEAEKNYFMEAIVLATKVANCPGIVGEICISDDPNYVTGYVASKMHGYRRITTLKEKGSGEGGRIFLYGGDKEKLAETIDFLQKKRVLVKNITPLAEEKQTMPLKIIESAVNAMKEKNLYRTMKSIQSAQGSHITLNGKDCVLMASNSYLDITAHPYMKEKVIEAVKKYGFGSGGSRLTTGNTDLHDALERKIAAFKDTEAALVFNTGYVANVAIISAIMKDGGIIFSDELNHASIIDGCRMTNASVVVYKHNDMDDLARKIAENPAKMRLAVSDGVFSMDGDILDLPGFIRVCKAESVLSMVDEAHSTGVIGEKGHGIVEHFNLSEKPDILMGTLSKAIGGEGGYAAGSQVLIDYLRNFARGFIFSTSLSPVTIAANIAGIEIIERESDLPKRLQENAKYFCACLQENGINASSETAIIPVIIGDEKKALTVSEKLLNAGFYISAIRYPTVAKGTARLRVALMSSHTKGELKRAAELIAEAMKS